MTEQYDLCLSEQAKAEALSQVKREPWSSRAKSGIEHLPSGWAGTGEDIRRFLLEELHLEPPHHHNAWGGVISGAVKMGIIIGTGRYTKMRAIKSHARKTEIYVRVREHEAFLNPDQFIQLQQELKSVEGFGLKALVDSQRILKKAFKENKL
jgi:hypothetical protein